MTCIVAVRDESGVTVGVTVGADRQGTAGAQVHYAAQPKISEPVKGVIVGVSGSYRVSQILEHELDWSDLEMRLRADDPLVWCVKKVIPAVRSELAKHAALKLHESVAEVEGAALLVVRCRIFVVYSDLQVFENADPYAAIGSGQKVALGSLHSTDRRTRRLRAEQALEAAARWIDSVGGPFDYLEQVPA